MKILFWGCVFLWALIMVLALVAFFDAALFEDGFTGGLNPFLAAFLFFGMATLPAFGIWFLSGRVVQSVGAKWLSRVPVIFALVGGVEFAVINILIPDLLT